MYTQGHTQTHTHRYTHRDAQRDTCRHTDIHTDTHSHTHTGTHRHRRTPTDTPTGTHTDIHTDTHTQGHTHRHGHSKEVYAHSFNVTISLQALPGSWGQPQQTGFPRSCQIPEWGRNIKPMTPGGQSCLIKVLPLFCFCFRFFKSPFLPTPDKDAGLGVPGEGTMEQAGNLPVRERWPMVYTHRLALLGATEGPGVGSHTTTPCPLSGAASPPGCGDLPGEGW